MNSQNDAAQNTQRTLFTITQAEFNQVSRNYVTQRQIKEGVHIFLT